MPLTTDEQNIITLLQSKQSNFDKLEKLLKSTNTIVLISEQTAPSQQLERRGTVYFSELLVVIARCQVLNQSLSDILRFALNTQFIDVVLLKEIIYLCAQLKDDKRNAFGKIIAFKSNDAYDAVRNQIGQKVVAEIMSIIENSDDFLSELSKYPILRSDVEQANQKINIQRCIRNFQKSKQELIDSERIFKKDMATLKQADIICKLGLNLSKACYPLMAKFVSMAKTMYNNSKQMQALFEEATITPEILTTRDTVTFFQNASQQLYQATILKNEIDTVEIEFFKRDNSDEAIKIKQDFDRLDQRGIISYLGLPFQRVCRYPLLLKEILGAISRKDEVGNILGFHNEIFQHEWNQYNTVWMQFKLFASKSNDSLKRVQQPETISCMTWRKSQPIKSNNRKELLLSKRNTISSPEHVSTTSDGIQSKVCNKLQYYIVNRPLPIPPLHKKIIPKCEIMIIEDELKDESHYTSSP